MWSAARSTPVSGSVRSGSRKSWCRRGHRKERFYVIASKKFRGRTDEELLSQGTYLRHKPPLLDETILDQEMKRRGIKAEPIMEFDSYDATLLMVEHDAGIGIVPEPYLSRQKMQELHCVPFGNPPLTREMGLMARQDSPNLYLVDLLWETIKAFSLPQRKTRKA